MASYWSSVATVLLIAVFSASAYKDVFLSDDIRAKLDEYRLPRYLTPISYVLKLVPRISDGYFNGSVEINVVCNVTTDTIVLHAHKDLNIKEDKINVMLDTVALSIIGITRNELNDTLTITIPEKLQQGQTYWLYFEFSGVLRTMDTDYWRNMDDGGFFMGSYEDTEKKSTSWYAVTTTYSNFARRIFPCFDEPAFKATFQISVARPSNMSTLSVMPVNSTELHEEGGLVWDHFPATPLLPTFSVNILVLDLSSLDLMEIPTSMGDFQLNIYSRDNPFTKDLPDNTKVIANMLHYIQEYLGFPYPLPKLDIVTMPGLYYINSPMYTMGLLIVPEYWLNSDYPELKAGLVNQWTTNLATPQDWISFNTTYIINSFLIKTISANVSKRFSYYGSPHHHYYIYSTSFNRTAFDEFYLYTTNRGEWLLQMLSYVLSNNTVSKALGNFITKNKYGTITERQLWKAMTLEAWSEGTLDRSLTVEEIVDTWLHNKLYRYPVLTVMRNYQEDSAYVEQHTFTSELPRNLTLQEESHLWMVPITYLTNNNLDISTPNQVTWIRDREAIITNLPDYNSFIVVNPNDAGMFLVNYDRHNWELIIQFLLDSPPQFTAATRLKLLNDAMLLAMGGELDYVTALNVTLFLRNETDYKTWNSMIDNLDKIETLYLFSPVESQLNTYVRNLMKNIINDSTAEPNYQSNPEHAIFYYNIRRIYNKFGNQKHIDEARKRLDDIMPTFTVNDNDTGLVVFCPEFMRNSSGNWSEQIEELQDFINEFYDMKEFLERNFAKCPGYALMIQRILDTLLDEDMVFASGRWDQMINMVTNSKEAQNITFSYFMENYNELKKKFYFMKDMWSSLVTGVTIKIRNEEQLNKLIDLYDSNKGKLGYTEELLDNSIKEVTKAVEWQKNNIQDIEYWLNYILPNFEL